MALNTDLMGLGMAAPLAGRTGHPPKTTLAGVGTTQTGAAIITTTNTVGTTTGGQTAFILPTKASAPAIAKEYYFVVSSSTSGLVYPAADGSTLNGSTSASVTVAQNKLTIFWMASNGEWYANVSA